MQYQITGGNDNRIFNTKPDTGEIYTVLDLWNAETSVSYLNIYLYLDFVALVLHFVCPPGVEDRT